jgi:hypothetical protein
LEPTTFSIAEVTAESTTTYEYTKFTISFQPLVDVEAGAYIMV